MTHIECIELLKRAVALCENSSKFDDEFSLIAHTLCLHGSKRALRFFSRKEHMVSQYLVHGCYDLFETKIAMPMNPVSVPEIADIKSFYSELKKKTWMVAGELSEIGNAFVVAGYRNFASPLYCIVEELHDYLIKINRMSAEYNLPADAIVPFHHLSRTENEEFSLHDCYEKKEKSQGYDL